MVGFWKLGKKMRMIDRLISPNMDRPDRFNFVSVYLGHKKRAPANRSIINKIIYKKLPKMDLYSGMAYLHVFLFF